MSSQQIEHTQHTVLLVDDEPEVLSTLRAILETDGHSILTATSAEQALTIVEATNICIVLTDVAMPGMDGLTLCRRIHADPRMAGVPVILVTGRVSDDDVLEGIRAGAVDYIKKPLDAAEIRLRVGTQLRLHESLLERTAAEKRLAIISSSAIDAIVMIDRDGNITHWNEAAESMFGYSRQEALGRDLHALIVPQRFHPAQSAAFPRFQKTGHGAAIGETLEVAATHRDGHEIPVELSLSSTQVAGQWHAVGIVRDITKRKRSEERYRVLFESSQDAIMTLEPPSWRFTSGNPAAIRVFGARDEQDFTSRGPWEYSPEHQPDGRTSMEKAKEMIETALRDGGVLFEWDHRRLSGDVFPSSVLLARMMVDGQPVLQATVRDVSKEKRVEVELGHARKLEAVGQLAAGIAHEINTPAQFVGDSIHFLEEAFEDQRELVVAYQRAVEALERVGGHEALLEEIKQAEEAADLEYLEQHVPGSFERCVDGLSRISTIVGAMKEFAHPDQREKSPADLNQALAATLTIARNEYKYVADVETEFGELPPVVCYVGDLNQVFLNLLVNAAHAISDVVSASDDGGSGDGERGDGPGGGSNDRGIIRVRTARDADTVTIEIQDTGGGIPEAVAARIFDPFFTTKAVGKGSGQGLAIARSIVVDKHQGSLVFDSAAGKGTTFTICLPIAGGRHESRPGAA